MNLIEALSPNPAAVRARLIMSKSSAKDHRDAGRKLFGLGVTELTYSVPCLVGTCVYADAMSSDLVCC